ncbi:MAG TPA: hypothetical protein VNL18_08450, partial [Gemmatimonadales bacterium]|nr:hypothetical protein [Gemmatimonadales bacterium]
ASLAPLALLLGCEAERAVVGSIAASRAAGFSAWSEPVSLGPTINTAFNDQQAALSKDGRSLYFASNRPGTPGPGPNDIWVSRRACVECPWTAPVNLGPPVNTGSNDAAPALSRDGHRLFLLSNRPGSTSSDIWVAWRSNVHDDFGWETPVNLGAGVNAAGFDGGPAFFENDEMGLPQLYFNANPAPVPAGGDIYLSEQAPDGSFGPRILVAELSSPSSDQRPSVASHGLAIYFQSDRPGSAETDIWSSTRQSVLEAWSPPVNLGPPINTGAGEHFPLIVSAGGTEWLYFTRNMAASPGFDFDLFVSVRTRGP